MLVSRTGKQQTGEMRGLPAAETGIKESIYRVVIRVPRTNHNRMKSSQMQRFFGQGTRGTLSEEGAESFSHSGVWDVFLYGENDASAVKTERAAESSV